MKHQARKNSAGLHGCISVLAFCVLGLPILLCASVLTSFYAHNTDHLAWDLDSAFTVSFTVGCFGISWIFWRAMLRDIAKLDALVPVFVFLFIVLPCVGVTALLAFSYLTDPGHFGWNAGSLVALACGVGSMGVTWSFWRAMLRDPA